VTTFREPFPILYVDDVARAIAFYTEAFRVRVCPASDEMVATIAATDTHVVVNCPALGGGTGECLVVERMSGR
jgi:predicted enzyme related to lactoylglutathione lyase